MDLVRGLVAEVLLVRRGLIRMVEWVRQSSVLIDYLPFYSITPYGFRRRRLGHGNRE